MVGITTEHRNGIAVLTLDDGGANAMDSAFFTGLDEALDASAGARAVVVAGREGMFSAGLDTEAIAQLDDAGLTDLFVTFGRTMLRLWGDPRPTVAAATGHAIAGGTILAMSCDHAVAAAGGFRWGLTQTTTGLPLPNWILAIARGNVRADRLDDLILRGRVLDAAQAVEVGYADDVVPGMQVLDIATNCAVHLADLPPAAYAYTKRQLRGRSIDDALADLERDVAAAMQARDSPGQA